MNAQNSTFQFLLRKIQLKTDFPALSSAISAINQLTHTDNENIHTLAAAILKDFALTHKLLRLVNSSIYIDKATNGISTISHAIVLLGLNTVRDIAISLTLFEHIQHHSNNDKLKHKLLESHLAASLAKNLMGVRAQEETFIYTLFLPLGNILAWYYFPEEAADVEHLSQQEKISEELAAKRILGINYEELGLAASEYWNLPSSMREHIEAIHRLTHNTNTNATHQHLIANLAKHYTLLHLSDITNHSPTGFLSKHEQQKHIQKIQKALNLSDETLAETWQKTLLEAHSKIAELQLTHTTHLAHQVSVATPSLKGIVSTPNEAQELQASEIKSPQHPLLMHCLNDITQTLSEDFNLNHVIQVILETLYRSLGFDHVMFGLSAPPYLQIEAKITFGHKAQTLNKHFHFILTRDDNLFTRCINEKADILITEGLASKYQQHLPEWYLHEIGAEWFLCLPLVCKGHVLGVIYADKLKAQDFELSSENLALIKLLRQQMLLAIKLSRK